MHDPSGYTWEIPPGTNLGGTTSSQTVESGANLRGEHDIYTLGDEIGQGDQGIVFLATTNTGNYVAVKKLHVNNAAQWDDIDRHIRNTHSLPASIDDVLLPKLLDKARDKDSLSYTLVQQFVAGKNLREDRKENVPAVNESVDIVTKVARVMHKIHTTYNLMHRDLKPSSIRIYRTKEGYELGIVDFGIARDPTTRGTATVARGDVNFAAPEQMAGNVVNPQTEVYTLCATLAYLITGNEPSIVYNPGKGNHEFTCKGLDEIVWRQGKKLVKIIRKGTHYKAKKRYKDAHALADALSKWKGGEELQRVEGQKQRSLRLWFDAPLNLGEASVGAVGSATVFGVCGAIGYVILAGINKSFPTGPATYILENPGHILNLMGVGMAIPWIQYGYRKAERGVSKLWDKAKGKLQEKPLYQRARDTISSVTTNLYVRYAAGGGVVGGLFAAAIDAGMRGDAPGWVYAVFPLIMGSTAAGTFAVGESHAQKRREQQKIEQQKQEQLDRGLRLAARNIYET